MIPVTLIFSSILVTVMIFMLKCGRLGFALVGLPIFNPLSANPTKWSNTLKQFLGFRQRIVLVSLTSGVGT